jgi:MFS family permease
VSTPESAEARFGPQPGHATPRRPPLYTRAFGLLWLTNFTFFAAFQFILPVIPLYVVHVGGRESDVGVLFGLTPLAALPVRLVSGPLLDRYGKKPLLLAGAAIFLVAISAYNWASSVAFIGALRALQGLGYGALTGAATALVADITPAGRRGEGLGVFSVGGNVSQAAAPALGLALYSVTGAFGPEFALASLAAATALLLAFFVPDVRPARLPTVMAETGPAPRPSLSPSNMVVRSALLPAFLQVFGTGAFSLVIAFIPLYARQLALPFAGLFYADVSISVLLSRVVFGRLSDRHGRQVVAVPGTGLAIASLLLLASGPSPTLFFLAGAAFGLGSGAAQPALLAYAIDRTPAHRRGAATSTYMIAVDMGASIFPAALGQVVPRAGYGGMYAVAAALLAGALVLYLVGLSGRLQRRSRV